MARPSLPSASDVPGVSLAGGRPLRELGQDTGGAVFVEYVTLLTLVSLGFVAATLALGVPLLRLYRYIQTVIAVPFP